MTKVKTKAQDAAPATAASEVAANARIASRYDQEPYASHPYPQSHPARLGAVARLFGLPAPAIESARVLEIGCAAGGNLIPLAAQYPNAHFTGLELSIVQADRADARIERLGLSNIGVIHGDVAEFSTQGAKFDYVICHGVYSWAPAPVREAIMRTIATCLSPNGVAYISYNVLPGWRPKQVLRDALMSRVSGLADVSAQIAFTRAFLARLKSWPTGDSVYHRALKEAAAQSEGARDDYLAHEMLSTDNEPQTFTQFIEDASRFDLAFLGECDMWMQIADNFDAATRDFARELSGNQIVPMEQSIDVLTGRTFRQTLLVHSARADKINRTLDPQRLAGLHLLGPVQELAEPEPGYSWSFAGNGQKRLSTSSPAARRAFTALADRGAASLSLDDCLAAAEATAPEDRALVLDAVYKAVAAGVIGIVAAPVAAATFAGERPRVPAWIRADVGAGETHVANLRHESATLDIVPRLIMPLLDGAHDRADLEAELVAKAKSGDLVFTRADGQVADDEGLAACAKEHVARTLDQLARAALLLPEDGAARP